MKTEIKPLYRKVNSTAHNSHHYKGGDAKDDRNTKNGLKKSLKKGIERGLDYTPLYKYLISKVGEDWDIVFSFVSKRLDKIEPISHIVIDPTDLISTSYGSTGIVRVGESSYYSALFVDDNNKLQLVNPNIKLDELEPSCNCCTHTFNGKPYIKKFDYEKFIKKYQR